MRSHLLHRLALGSLLLLGSVAQAASGWQTYHPDALPPLVQDAYPGNAVKLILAQQSSEGDPVAQRAQVDALAASWVGAAPRWFVRLTQDGSEALVVSKDGLKPLAVRITAAGVLGFELTLKTSLTPRQVFTPVPAEDAFWTRTLPVSQLGFSTAICPEGIELGAYGITVTTPANFPLPGGKKLVQELRCQGLEVHEDGGTYQLASRITVRAATWQQAWALVAPSSMVKLLTPGSFTIQHGVATVSSTSSSVYFFPDDVIAVQNGTSLQPLVFQKKLTPWTLRDGENRFYLHTNFGSWNFISIDTRSAVVTLIRSYAMPTP